MRADGIDDRAQLRLIRRRGFGSRRARDAGERGNKNESMH
jgi:hypothetical protein